MYKLICIVLCDTISNSNLLFMTTNIFGSENLCTRGTLVKGPSFTSPITDIDNSSRITGPKAKLNPL